MCYEDGIVEFPYDGLKTRLPLERGENLIVGKSDTGEFCVIDVISKRRWLLLSMLSAIVGKVSTGKPLAYGIGSHLFIGNLLFSFLKRTNLRAEAGYEIPWMMSEKLQEKFRNSLVGCQFNWDKVFGYVKPEKLNYRVDRGEFKNFPMQYQVEDQLKVFSSMPTVRIVTVEDLMRHSLDIPKIGICYTSQLFPKAYRREFIGKQLDFEYLFKKYGEDMKSNYKFVENGLMARRTINEEFSASSCGQQFLTNLFLRIWGVQNIWVVAVPENIEKDNSQLFRFLEFEKDQAFLNFTEEEYLKVTFSVMSENRGATLGAEQAPIYTTCSINDGISLVAGNNRAIGILANMYREAFDCITMKKTQGCVMSHDSWEDLPGRGRLMKGSISGEGRDYAYVFEGHNRLQDSLTLHQSYHKRRKK